MKCITPHSSFEDSVLELYLFADRYDWPIYTRKHLLKVEYRHA